MKIEIIFDNTERLRSQLGHNGNLEVYSSDTDYFDAYVSLQNAIKKQGNKTIIVYSKPLQDWLYEGLSKYKKADIILRKNTFRDLLSQKWKVKFDIDISDSEIERDNLLSLGVEGLQEQPLTSFVCDNFISAQLNTLEFNRGKYGELLSDLIKFEKVKDTLPQIVKKALQHKLNNWLKPGNEYEQLIGLLISELENLYIQSCIYKLIKKYPKHFQVKCISDRWLKIFEKAKLNMDGLSIDLFRDAEKHYNKLLDELDLFYKSFKLENLDFAKDSLEKLLSYVSGELSNELGYILEILENEPVLINKNVIVDLKKKFNESALILYVDKIEDLANFIIPVIPSAFDKNLDIEATIKWAVEEYLPYRYWMENTGKGDKEILKYGIAFADYIFENYSVISYNHKILVYSFLYNFKKEINQTLNPIFLLLDNFNYKFFNKLKSAFEKHNIIIEEQKPYISLLPTETLISKSSIMANKRDKVDSAEENYEKKLKKTSKEFFKDYNVKYFSKAGELAEYRTKDKELIVINYNEIDKELHDSFQRTAIEHRKKVSFIIDNITELIAGFIQKNKIENKTKIFFVSDHGSTLIKQNIPNDIDSKYFKNEVSTQEHRFIILEDKKFEKMKNNVNVAHTVFCLSKETSGDSNNYIIARGYNRFKDIKDDFYVHGGALPEEIIVPGGYFKYGKEAVKDILLQLLKTEYRLMTKESISIRLANPNSISATNILVLVIANEEILSEIRLDNLAEKSEEVIESDIRISNKDIKLLRVNLNYELKEKTYKQDFDFPIIIKRLTTVTTDIDNL